MENVSKTHRFRNTYKKGKIIMKKILVSIVIMAMSAVWFCACGSSEATPEDNSPTYDVSVQVECNKNLIFSKYDVDILIDDRNIGTLEHGAVETFKCNLTEGEHNVVFQKEDE